MTENQIQRRQEGREKIFALLRDAAKPANVQRELAKFNPKDVAPFLDRAVLSLFPDTAQRQIQLSAQA